MKENEVKPTYLYIKQHSITKKFYFGKTINKDFFRYKGSGVYWTNHIKKHGYKFVKTLLVIGPYTNKEELQNLAIWMSDELDIVNSTDWANQCVEIGLGGGNEGYKHTEEYKKHKSEQMTGRTTSRKGTQLSEEHIEALKVPKVNGRENHIGSKGYKFTEEQKQKQRLSQQNVKLVTCPHCNKTGRPGPMKQHHFDNCKIKNLDRINTIINY